jgi:hypothetical protein
MWVGLWHGLSGCRRVSTNVAYLNAGKVPTGCGFFIGCQAAQPDNLRVSRARLGSTGCREAYTLPKLIYLKRPCARPLGTPRHANL